jgi:hypothetical protein
MNRQEKIQSLTNRTDEEVRQPALNLIDEEARRANTFGSKEHRAARDRVEMQHDESRRGFEGLTEARLDAALALAQ